MCEMDRTGYGALQQMSFLISCSRRVISVSVLGVMYTHYPTSSVHEMDYFVPPETSLKIKTSAVYHRSRDCGIRISIR